MNKDPRGSRNKRRWDDDGGNDSDDYVPSHSDYESSSHCDGSIHGTDSSPSSSCAYRKRKRRRTMCRNKKQSYPEVASPLYNLLPIPLKNRRSYVPTPDGTPQALGVPSWNDTFRRSATEKRAIKKRHHGYHKKLKRRAPSIDIEKRWRNHINPKAFEYYTGLDRCWYNAKDVVIAMNTGRVINAHMMRLNHAYNLANELLTDAMITNNIIEYGKESEGIDTDCHDEQYWKSLIAHLEADNQTLQHMHNKMTSEMVARHKKKTVQSSSNQYQASYDEQFNDLSYYHKEYAQHKHKLHEKSYIEKKLSTETLDRYLSEIEQLKNGPNATHKAMERKNELYRYYKRDKRKKMKKGNESESELQTDDDMIVEEEKRRYDLDPNYNIKYEHFHDIAASFDIKKLNEGLPNGALLTKIAKIFEAKNKDFTFGKQTLIELPVNDSVYPHIMADLVKKYHDNK